MLSRTAKATERTASSWWRYITCFKATRAATAEDRMAWEVETCSLDAGKLTSPPETSVDRTSRAVITPPPMVSMCADNIPDALPIGSNEFWTRLTERQFSMDMAASVTSLCMPPPTYGAKPEEKQAIVSIWKEISDSPNKSTNRFNAADASPAHSSSNAFCACDAVGSTWEAMVQSIRAGPVALALLLLTVNEDRIHSLARAPPK
mmetsp:Transcript_13505/g.28659  ORF Transcript_13505/g.28659 Transcript_13505/m.28659 type:complete len:205 (+) Transcript_13505:482-1096(+)